MGHHHCNYRQETVKVENITPRQYCQASWRLVKRKLKVKAQNTYRALARCLKHFEIPDHPVTEGQP